MQHQRLKINSVWIRMQLVFVFNRIECQKLCVSSNKGLKNLKTLKSKKFQVQNNINIWNLLKYLVIINFSNHCYCRNNLKQ